MLLSGKAKKRKSFEEASNDAIQVFTSTVETLLNINQSINEEVASIEDREHTLARQKKELKETCSRNEKVIKKVQDIFN